jgi:hypothetical protein
VASLLTGSEQSDVIQGGQVTLYQQFETFKGSGYAAPASSVTIGITAASTPGAGSGTPVPAGSAGIQVMGPANFSYAWTCDPEQAPGDYIVTWTGIVNGTTLTYQQSVTVASIPALTPAPGVYASVAQYQTWSGDLATPPGRVQVMLQRASEDLDMALVAAVYPVNANGMPTDPMVIDLFMRACSAQCQFLLADNDPAGIKRQYSSTSMGGVSQTRIASMTGMQMPPLGPRAAQILHVGGVLPSAPLISWLTCTGPRCSRTGGGARICRQYDRDKSARQQAKRKAAAA